MLLAASFPEPIAGGDGRVKRAADGNTRRVLDINRGLKTPIGHDRFRPVIALRRNGCDSDPLGNNDRQIIINFLATI
jgi:hypothetical protein